MLTQFFKNLYKIKIKISLYINFLIWLNYKFFNIYELILNYKKYFYLSL